MSGELLLVGRLLFGGVFAFLVLGGQRRAYAVNLGFFWAPSAGVTRVNCPPAGGQSP